MQLTGAELIPFSADKATIFSAAVYLALGNQTIYSVNVSDVTTTSTPLKARCFTLREQHGTPAGEVHSIVGGQTAPEGSATLWMQEAPAGDAPHCHTECVDQQSD